MIIINDIAENPFLRVPPGYNSWAIWMDLTITGLETGDPIDPPATAAVFVLEPPDPGAPTVPESQLALGHGTFVNEQPFVEILPPATESILDETSCRASLAASLQGLQGLAARLIGPFSPSLALADPGELGGRLSAGSPLGAVDPLSDTETALVLSPPDDGEVTATATVTVVNDTDQSLGTGALVDFVLDPGGEETVLATVAPDANNQAVATFTCSDDVSDGDQIQARFYGPNDGTDGTDTRAPSESNIETVDCGEEEILGSISGTVFGPDEEEYNGATVTLEMWDGDSWEFVASTTSGPQNFEDVAAGFYSFGNLAVGPNSLEDPNYRVSAADPDAGLASGFQEVLLTESNPDAEFVNLFLQPVIE